MNASLGAMYGGGGGGMANPLPHACIGTLHNMVEALAFLLKVVASRFLHVVVY
jgi:hypothetical protein